MNKKQELVIVTSYGCNKNPVDGIKKKQGKAYNGLSNRSTAIKKRKRRPIIASAIALRLLKDSTQNKFSRQNAGK